MQKCIYCIIYLYISRNGKWIPPSDDGYVSFSSVHINIFKYFRYFPSPPGDPSSHLIDWWEEPVSMDFFPWTSCSSSAFTAPLAILCWLALMLRFIWLVIWIGHRRFAAHLLRSQNQIKRGAHSRLLPVSMKSGEVGNIYWTSGMPMY